MLRRVMEDPPSYPRDARGLDGKLWAVIMGALRKDPAERTPSALALRTALSSWLESKGITPSSHPSSRKYRGSGCLDQGRSTAMLSAGLSRGKIFNPFNAGCNLADSGFQYEWCCAACRSRSLPLPPHPLAA